MKFLFSLLFVLVFTAFGADVAGAWKAALETPNGSMETTFVFKVDGNKLTGSTSNQFIQDQAISEGTVDGDKVAFTVVSNFNGNEFKLKYKGVLAGDELKLTMTVEGRDRTMEMTAKRSK